MSSKTTKKQEVTPTATSLVLNLEDIMGERFARYSKYIIQDRALPDARDGLKPVQRRILYAMNEDGNTFDKPYRKSAKTVGLVIGNYHPHGDSSVYDAMVRMSQDWKIRTPQIDMQGNNGSIDDDPAAAMRYTEARLSKISSYLMKDIEKDTVSWAPNFDDTSKEPTVFPAAYPNLLVNGITGIAAGYATNIPPHNLNECLDACILRTQKPDCSLEEAMEYVKGPDFPTGGIIQGKDGIINAFKTGRGKIMVRSKVEIVSNKTLQQLIVSEIPYEVVKAIMVKKIDEIRLDKKIEGILDVRDESDRNGLRIVVDIKKDMNAQQILNYLYKNTDLQVSYNYNVIAIVNKRPMQLGLLEMLDAFLAHRRDVIKKRSIYDLNKKSERCHILEGLIRAISVLDEIIRLIRASKDKADSKRRIIEAFDFSEAQAEAIVSMRLYRLSNTDVVLLQSEYEQLQKEIKALQEIIAQPKKLDKVMIKEFKELKKEFPLPRLSVIEDEIEEIVVDKMAMIPSEQIMVSVTSDGYMKRVSLRSYQAANTFVPKLKEEDTLVGYKEANTLQQLIFFTNTGTYGYLPIYELDEAKWKDVGSHINAKMKITPQEKICNAYTFTSFDSDLYMVSITRKGMIKRTPLKEFEVSRNNKTMTAMKINKDDSLLCTLYSCKDDEIVLLSKKGFMVRYPLALVNPTAPRSQGIKAMNLMDDEIVGAVVYQSSNAQLVVVTNEGDMKRLRVSDVEMLGRPVKGSMCCKKRKSNPYEMHSLHLGLLTDQLVLLDEEHTSIMIRDIPLKSKDATFSHVYANKGDMQFFHALQELPVVEYEISNSNQTREHVENYSLFDETN